MIILSIDPGLSGAIAWIDTADDSQGFSKLPIRIYPKGKKMQKELDAVQLTKIITKVAPKIIGLEAVHAMPGQGVTSMFTFGKNYGLIEAAVRLYIDSVKESNAYFHQFTPQTWKKFAHIKEKEEAYDKLGGQVKEQINEISTKEHRLAASEAFWMCKYLESEYVST